MKWKMDFLCARIKLLLMEWLMEGIFFMKKVSLKLQQIIDFWFLEN